jgi:hypothetical protein
VERETAQKNERTSNQASCDKEALKKNAQRRFRPSFSALIKERDAIKITQHGAIKVAGKKPLSAFEIMQRGIEAEAESRRKQYLPLPPRPITMGY